jgi:hypothetical protein
VSTMTFSPDGMASRYRLCATTTFTRRRYLYLRA